MEGVGKGGRCASFYLLHWTRSIFPRGSQSGRRPLSWPANGERGPSDRHCIQPRVVGHGGGAHIHTVAAVPVVNAAVSFSCILVAERTDRLLDVSLAFIIQPSIRGVSEWPAVSRSFKKKKKMYFPQRCVLSCTHTGRWQTLHSSHALAPVFTVVCCRAYVSAAPSVCFQPPRPAASAQQIPFTRRFSASCVSAWGGPPFFSSVWSCTQIEIRIQWKARPLISLASVNFRQIDR